jgi:flagellar biosynthesis protein FliQ
MVSAMAADVVLRALREGLVLVLLLSAPPLLATFVVGIVVGALQSATQIQDPSVSFVPKLVACALVLLVSAPMLSAQVVRFTQALLLAIPTIR